MQCRVNEIAASYKTNNCLAALFTLQIDL